MKIGTTELLVILVIVMLLFGPTQLPKLTRMFGKSVKSFRKGMSEEDETDTSSGAKFNPIKNETTRQMTQIITRLLSSRK